MNLVSFGVRVTKQIYRKRTRRNESEIFLHTVKYELIQLTSC